MADQPNPAAVVDPPAAPAAPAPEPSAKRSSFADFDHAETEKDLARLPGKAAPVAVPAAPAAGENDDAPAVDAKGAPVTGTDGKPISRRQQENNRRIQEAIDRGLAESRTRLDAAEKRAADAEARLTGRPPAAQPEAAPPAAQPAATETEPTLAQFADQADPYLEFGKAHALWVIRQELKARDAAAQERQQQEAGQKAAQDTFTKFQGRVDAFKATAPDFDTKTLALRESLDVRSPLTQAVVDSEFAPQLLLHLAEHPDDFDRIGRLGMSNMAAALREIGRLEGKFDTGAASAASPQSAPPAPPKPKLVTDAPPIGTVLGNQPAPAADPSRAAIARRDFAAFDEAETQKDLARRRR